MKVVTLGEDEREILKALSMGKPLREIPMPLRGRLSLYKLITETTQGWLITDDGREALANDDRGPAKENPETLGTRPAKRSQVSGKRMPLRRKSPFDG